MNHKVNRKLKQKKSFDYKKFFFIFLGIFLLFFLFYIGFDFSNKISGKSILNIEASYQEAQPLEGSLTLSLKQGELIPSSSKIVITNAGVEKEYELHELVSNNVVEGNFYVEGKSLEGAGEGYGVLGVKEIYPVVYFKLNIFSEEEIIEEEIEESEVLEEIIEEEVVEEVEEPEITENIISETEQETTTTETPEETIEQPEETLESQQVTEEVTEIQETPSEIETPSEEAPITGNVIAKLFGESFNFFLELTGRVSMEIETEIEGEVSKDKPFVYNLREGQEAEIISSSKDVEMNIKNNEIVVTTDYVEYEEGFGEDYVGGDYANELVVDLSELTFTANKGEMVVSLVYGSEEIISLTVDLAEDLVSEKEIKKQNVSNETVLDEEVNETILNESMIMISPDALSDDEKKVLLNKFGNVSMEMTKAEVFNERLIIKYELGSLWIEYSYDYSGKIDDKLNSQIEEDKIKWLKDLADRFLQDETGSEEIANMTKKINIF